jgi:hypothetical protein
LSYEVEDCPAGDQDYPHPDGERALKTARARMVRHRRTP